jgi:hypothetical protein
MSKISCIRICGKMNLREEISNSNIITEKSVTSASEHSLIIIIIKTRVFFESFEPENEPATVTFKLAVVLKLPYNF